MRKCKNCGVNIKDPTDVCPLCQNVLVKTDGEKHPKMYPNVRKKVQLISKIWKIALFIIIILELFLLILNQMVTPNLRWSWIVGVALIYVMVSTYHFLIEPASIRWKLLVQSVLIFIVLFALDYTLGMKGWSISIGFPCVILSLDLIVMVLMIVQIRFWQNYLILLIYSFLMSVVELVFWHFDFYVFSVLPWITFGVTSLFFLFCTLFGTTKTKNELKRRFHV